MPAGNWIKLGGVFIAISLCLVGYFEHWIGWGEALAILVPTIIYALFEFSVKERRERT
jgi:hypothetical protein